MLQTTVQTYPDLVTNHTVQTYPDLVTKLERENKMSMKVNITSLWSFSFSPHQRLEQKGENSVGLQSTWRTYLSESAVNFF